MISRAHLVLAGFFRVSLDGLSERGTTLPNESLLSFRFNELPAYVILLTKGVQCLIDSNDVYTGTLKLCLWHPSKVDRRYAFVS